MKPVNRRDFLKRSSAASAGALLSAALPLSKSWGAGPEKRPNILLITVDDLRPQMGCYGKDFMHTPHMDALAAKGVLFERAYCMAPQCGPSRASFFSGLRPTPTRFFNRKMPAGYHPHEIHVPHVTLPRYLKDNGYETMSLGKVWHGFETDLEGWSLDPWRPEQVIQSWHGPSSYGTPSIRQKVTQAIRQGDRRAKGPATERADVADDALPDGKLAHEAIARLKARKEGDKPFFMALGFLRPHLPFAAPKKYWDLYDPNQLHMTDNPFPPLKAPKETLHEWRELRAYQDIPKKGRLTDEKARELVHAYYACVSYTDAQVGRIMKALGETGQAENTIVVLWGDHGWNLQDHGLWCKHSHFETSLHSPLIVRAPGIKGNQRTPALTEMMDVYPSLCELAGLPIPEHVEGSSFAPLLQDPARPWKPAIFSQWRNDGISVKTDRYRYTQWVNGQNQPVAEMLYDHEADPEESKNIASEPAMAQIVKEHRALLKAGWKPISEKLSTALK